MSLARLTPARLGSYGEHWGEGASRCFSLDGDFLDEEQGVRLMPVPESFICPISMCVMENPVATVDGAIYERAYIEHWHRQRREEGLPITSPATGIELPSPTLMPLTALQKAIETYITHRPEIKDMRMNGRALQEAATLLQSELLDKQAAHANAQDELTRLRDMLLERDLRCAHLSRKLEQAKHRLRLLESSQEGSDKLVAQGVAVDSDVILSKKLCDTSVVKKAKACDDCCSSPMPEKPVAAAAHSGSNSGSRKWSLALPAGWHSEGSLHCRSKESFQQLPRHLVVAGCVATLLLALLALHHSEQLEQAQALAGVMSVAASAPMAELLASSVAKSNCSEDFSMLHGVNTLFPAGAVVLPGVGPELEVTLRDLQRKLAGGPADKLQAISSLFQLAASSVGNQIEMVQADVIRPLIDLLNDDLPHLCEMAANVVAVLASTAEGSRAIISLGAVGPLLRVLEAGNPGARMQAASVFATLAAADSKSKDALTLGGAIPALVSLLKDEDPRIREVGANALAHLAAGSRRNQELVANEGAASCLVRLLRGSSWPSQQHAARALAALAKDNPRTAAEVERSGALGPLVALLQGARPPQVQGAASVALENLVESGGLRPQEMVPHLVRSLQQQQQLGGSWAAQGLTMGSGDFASQEEDARQRQLDGSSRAAKLLKIVAAGGKSSQDAVVQAGALPPLVAMLACEGADCAEARIQASEALTMLADGNTANQIHISRSGAIAPLVHLLDSGSVDEQVSAAGALEQLLLHSGEDRQLITQAAAKIDRILS